MLNVKESLRDIRTRGITIRLNPVTESRNYHFTSIRLKQNWTHQVLDFSSIWQVKIKVKNDEKGNENLAAWTAFQKRCIGHQGRYPSGLQ